MLTLNRFNRRPCAREEAHGHGSSAGAIATPQQTSPTTPLPPPISQTTFFVGSLAVFSIGLLLGLRRAVKEEKATLRTLANDVNSMYFGAKAFLYGSVLAVGSSAGGIAVFMYATDIHDLQTFAFKAKETIEKTGIIPPPQIETAEAREEREQLERDAEKAYRELFEDDEASSNSEKEDEKKSISWQEKMERLWTLKDKLSATLSSTEADAQNPSTASSSEKSGQSSTTEDSTEDPKWLLKLKRIFGIAK